MHNGQLRIPARGEFGGFDEHALQMFVAFLGDRPPLFLAGRLPLGAAQPAVADCFADGIETPRIANLKHPGQRSDFADSADGHQAADPIPNYTVGPQGMNQLFLDRMEHLEATTTHSQQVP